jgi:pimeloyl-ACP methyl ester carboxylesterase
MWGFMNINIERYGWGERIVFLHGSAWNTRMWYKQRDSLRSSMEVMLLDLPGHGRAPGNGCDSVEEYRDEVYKAIKRLDVGCCYVAGHSLGGAVAMSLALSHPEAVLGVVLIGTGARLKVLPQILEGVKENKENTIDNVIALAFSKKASSALKKEGFDEMMKCSAEVIYKDFKACDRFDVMDSIGSLKSPALIMCGTDDSLTPPKYSRYLHKTLPDASLLLIEDAGHMVMMEKPDETNRAIEKFVGGDRGPSGAFREPVRQT